MKDVAPSLQPRLYKISRGKTSNLSQSNEDIMSLVRVLHWDTRALHQFLLDQEKAPFKYGENDCCLFAASAVQSFTNVDIASQFSGKYKTQLGALKTIKALTGGSTVADAVAYCASKNRLEEYEHCLVAKRGDLVLIDNGGDLIAGIVHLSGRHVVSISDTGLMRLPITSIKRSWAV